MSLDRKVAEAREAGRRLLFYIPIFHSQEDMGSLGKLLPMDGARHRFTRTYWQEIAHGVRALALPWPAVKVYQDGLPDAPADIITKILAEVQSPNYDLLRWLVAQGAELIGTESPLLMKEEYEHLRAVLTAEIAEKRAAAQRAYAERAPALLAERDAFIGRRIAETLPASGFGILLVGGAHCVAPHLPEDIVVLKIGPSGDHA